jgi:hypothetical protein
VEQCCIYASTVVGIGGVVQRGLDARCEIMDSCRVMAIPGTMVVSTSSLARIMRISTLKMA